MKNQFESMFVPGALLIPENLLAKQAFCAAPTFKGPKELVEDGYLTPIENQGSKPWCAAYSATSYAEAILWRKNGYHKDIDPAPIYKHAKTIDGNPTGDGTSLTAVLEALTARDIFDKNICKIRTFGGLSYGNESYKDAIKYAIHKYGCCLIGCDIDTSWYTPKAGVINGGGKSLGGHAVVCYGYTEEGFLILNSWGEDWGYLGKGYLPNNVFDKQFIYGALLTRTLDGLE